MKTHHRIPSIFSLSMVDMLCCALGCVLLLWLLNVREASDRAAEAGLTVQELHATEERLSKARQELETEQKKLTEASAQLTKLLKTTAALNAELDKSKDLASANRKRFESAEEEARALMALLEKTRTDLEMTRGERDKTRDAKAELEKKLAALGKQTEGVTGKLTDAEARIKKLLALADQLPALRDELKGTRDKLDAEHALALALEKNIKQRLLELTDRDKELEELRATTRTLEEAMAARDKELNRLSRGLADIEGARKTLLKEVTQAKATVDNRFAGINLTGKRVIFLIDKSGSMGMIDPQTEAKEKWPAVRQTLARIMRSLPDLEKFQVIIFAQDAAYLLGQDDRWIDYDPRASAERVTKALAETDPKGGTNLQSAFEAAFRYRALGLDTIYLISDGLPDRGAALPANSQNWTALERSEYLSKQLRNSLKSNWNRPLTDGSRVRINCVGFFYESPDVGAFLWALSRENDGSFVGMSRP